MTSEVVVRAKRESAANTLARLSRAAALENGGSSRSWYHAPRSIATVPAMSRRSLLLASLLAAVSVGVTVAAAEIALRLRHGGLAARPGSGSSALQISDARSQYPTAYDPLLGYAPRAGVSGVGNIWQRSVTIDADTLRENGRGRPSGAPILALGDSFTFGDEVDDADTWPAQLEARLARPVLNGGVFGYGLDQMVLRGERLLAGPARAADVVILSLLPEDVLRCEFSYRYAWKPYFAIADGQLALRNVPVPQPHEGPPGESWLRRALRHSYVADRAFRLLDPDGWGVPDAVRAHRDGGEVARLLLDRLAARVRAERRAFLIVIQWAPNAIDAPIAPLLARARELAIPVLDLAPVLEPLVRARGIGAAFLIHIDPDRASGIGHMNLAGNRVAAEAIAIAVSALASDGAVLPAKGSGGKEADSSRPTRSEPKASEGRSPSG
jgi:hypothetical protein